jgi:formate-dependent nitrite reductase cytochrome c552 subunit
VALILILLAAISLAAQESPCAACHGEPVEDLQTHKHASNGVQCATCHGPSEKHRLSIGGAPPDRVAAPNEVAALCGTCHAKERNDFDASAHGKVYAGGKQVRSANCNTCHGHHSLRPWSAMAETCARCHAQLPASCKEPPKSAVAKVACMNCHARHSLAAVRKP